jgi:hypothetical protein
MAWLTQVPSIKAITLLMPALKHTLVNKASRPSVCHLLGSPILQLQRQPEGTLNLVTQLHYLQIIQMNLCTTSNRGPR